ncbi:polysaccharide Lyase [Saccharobesus litoralis]|uniref:Polysaccharide Lyase n=2 Tax=Saccharobesus litoralis TaxID=2172099 RepID=A0A2S0VXN5_9ALTE|nr:polysaccharide Lyase [Saccharobesus litoralis]
MGCGSGSEDTTTVDDDIQQPKQNTAAKITGDITATVTEPNDITVNRQLTIDDPDEGEAQFTVVPATASQYGTYEVSASGNWIYELDRTNADVKALSLGQTITDTFQISSVDGTKVTINIKINGAENQQTNHAATFSGDSAVSINQNHSQAVSGKLTVSDIDTGEDAVQVQTNVSTTYGQFSIDSSGNWNYQLNVSKPEISNLTDGNQLYEDIYIYSVDGTASAISIEVKGIASQPSIVTTPDDTVPTINCTQTVNSIYQLESAASFTMTPGETLCLAAGNYTGLDLEFGGVGSADKPITIAAEEPGKVIIGGEVAVAMTGEYVVLQGFVFKDGTIDNTIIQTRANSSTPCNYCRITENAIIDMDEGLTDSTKWLYIYGAYNRIDHNWFAGKTTRGALLAIDRYKPDGVDIKDMEVDHAIIDHNYFGDRPPVNGQAYAASSDNEYEAIRIGTSDSHMGDSYSQVKYNYFERIQGEAEVISNKSGNNTISHNTIRDSYGSIVTRHGEYATINNNFIFGDDHPFSGGIRIVDGNHTVVNNYVQGARYQNSNWNGGIVLTSSNGSTSNGYQDVENVLVAHNTIVDSVNSLNVFGGKESTKADSVYFVNNLIANAIGAVVKNANDMPSNSTFSNNTVYGQSLADNGASSISGLTFSDPQLELASDNLYRPSSNSSYLDADTNVAIGNFTLPTHDMDGQSRSSTNLVGADTSSNDSVTMAPLTASQVGPKSYRPAYSKGYVKKVMISNHDFDTGDTSGWTNNGAQITSDTQDVFSRGASIKLDSVNANIEQNVYIQANTYYTFSAFIKGIGRLSVVVDGQTYSTDVNNSNYQFTSVSFHSGSATQATLRAVMDDTVKQKANILNANFDNKQTDWQVYEGSGIGQVQDSSNSASGADGSIKFKYDSTKGDNGTPHDPYIAQEIDVLANTDYTLSMYVLEKSNKDAQVKYGVYTTDIANILASHIADVSQLGDAPKGDDSFRQTTLTFNSGTNTKLTVFAQYQGDGSEIRVDDFSLTYDGSPIAGDVALFDSLRLVSHTQAAN